jgi:DNA-directed RNA polymerase subunit RPC12/RpoP
MDTDAWGGLLGGLVGFSIVGLAIWGLIAWAKAQKQRDEQAIREIGQIRCKRCGHVGHPEAMLEYHGMASRIVGFRCERCGSEDWQACGRNEVQSPPPCREEVQSPPPAKVKVQSPPPRHEQPAIRFTCSSCSKEYTVPANKAGMRTRCPACGWQVIVPAQR